MAIVDNLSNQIRLMNRAVGRDLSTDPARNDWLVLQLATLLARAGTTNLLHLYYFADQAEGVSFFADYVTGHVFEDQNPNVNSAAWNEGKNGGGLFTVLSQDGRELDQIYLFFTKDGYPVFWNQSMDNGSDWADVRTGIIFIGSIVLAAVGVPIATGIGNAVLGAELASTYPALAQGIGQAVINTLLNGGDIEKGAISAVASFAGAGVGAQVTSASGYDAIGQAAAAATRAYITGGDLDKAVASSLLRNGVDSMQTLLSSAGGDDTGTADFFSDDSIDYSDFDATGALPDFGGFSSADLSAIGDLQMGQYYTDENGVTYGVDAQGDLAVVDMVDDNGIGYATDVDGDPMVLDAPTSADIAETYTVTDSNGTVPLGQGGGVTSSLLSSLATTALSLVTSYVKAGAPQIRTSSANATVNANGTVTTRNANGTVTTTKPAVGTPYLTASGALVTNNGDGTYTTVSPNGAITTKSYAATSASPFANIPPAVLYGGVAAAVGLLLLSQRRN